MQHLAAQFRGAKTRSFPQRERIRLAEKQQLFRSQRLYIGAQSLPVVWKTCSKNTTNG
jgi:hypothetical protein